jgi:hypothetical protein
MHGVPISKISTCGATVAANATVASKSNESHAIWVKAMVNLRFKLIITIKSLDKIMYAIYCDCDYDCDYILDIEEIVYDCKNQYNYIVFFINL